MTDYSKLSDAELTALYERTKDPFTAALKAEGVPDSVAAIARSIYQQESGSGSNTKTSNAGAEGGMQVIPSTFDSVADKGWDRKDPYDNARAGIRYVKQMYDKAGGDPALTAAGYYGGPGGLEKARQGVAVSDPRNPNAPDTLQYGKQIAARIPKGTVASALDKVTDAIIPSAKANTLSGSPYEKMSDAELIAAYEASKKETPAVAGKRSTMDELGRQPGLTARLAVNAAASLPVAITDAVTGAVNSGLDLVQGKDKGFRFQGAGKSLNNLMTAAGLPEPDNGVERVVQDIGSAVGGAGGMIKGGEALAKYGGPVAQGVGKMLAAGPALQVASAATGAGASGVTREAGGGAGAQLAAGLAGSLAPGFANPARQAITRGALRGGEAGRQRVADNIATFKEASGVTPTIGQATESRTFQAAESMLSKVPGGAGVMTRKADGQLKGMAASVQQLSDELAPGANAVNAGEAIERGINSFKEGTKIVQQRLYANLDRHIPADTPITSERTMAALADLNTDIAGAPALSKWFKNAKIQGIEGGLKSDTSSLEAVLSRPGMRQQVTQMQGQLESEAARVTAANAERRMLGMNNMEPVMTPAQIKERVDGFLTQQVDSRLPYESVKKLRTLVGRELADNSFASDVPRSKWSALYGALSDDLGVAAKNAGPEAEKVWNWANTYSRTQLDRLDQLKGIMSRDAPEKIFNAATAGTAEGATTITRVINALPKQERREVAAAVLQRMGRATAGQQNAMGDAFSSETFLTNLSKISPEARTTIFGRTGIDGLEEQVGRLADMAGNLRKGSKVFANPSGTAQVLTLKETLGTAGAAFLTGNIGAGMAALGVPVAANAAARFTTTPSLVKFAAGKTSLREGALASAVGATTRLNAQDPQSPSPYAHLSDEELTAAYQSSMAPTAQDPAAMPGAVEPARFELNGMAEPEAIHQGDQPVNTPLEQAGPEAPQPAFTSEQRADGTLSIRGDPQALRATLMAAGIPAQGFLATRDGLLVGRTQAAQVQQALSRQQQPGSMPSEASAAAAAPEPDHIAAIGAARTIDEAIAAASRATQVAPLKLPDIPASAPMPTPEKISMLAPGSSTEPSNVWFGRRGDGYSSVGDASLALRSRQKSDPSLDWRMEEMPSGRIRLAGYPAAGQDNHAPSFAKNQQVDEPGGAFDAFLQPNGTLAIRGDSAAVRAVLAEYGITGIRTRDAVMVGTSQAQAAMKVLSELSSA